MLTEDLYTWLMKAGHNQLATDVNRAAGMYADFMADVGGFTDEEVYGDGTEPEDVPDPDDG